MEQRFEESTPGLEVEGQQVQPFAQSGITSAAPLPNTGDPVVASGRGPDICSENLPDVLDRMYSMVAPNAQSNAIDCGNTAVPASSQDNSYAEYMTNNSQ